MGIVVKLKDEADKTSLENGDKLLKYKEDQKYMLIFGPNGNLEDKTLKIKEVDKEGGTEIKVEDSHKFKGNILDASCSEHYIVAHGSDTHAVKEFLTNFVNLLPRKTRLKQNMKYKIILVVCNAVNRNHNASLEGRSFLSLLLKELLKKQIHDKFEVIAFDLYVGVRFELTDGNSFARVYVTEKIFRKDENGQFIKINGEKQIETLKNTNIKQPDTTTGIRLFDTSFIVKDDGKIWILRRNSSKVDKVRGPVEILYRDERIAVSNISGSKKASNMTKIKRVNY